ncbi:Nicotine blue oxidoreductase [Arthrobacter saudimassiliensis]|uniref:Nicotine blue oxidoreductase n=1 Tax=Arthrobacter saudimassiliensis TaxID=1461584 RepID=A0A078MRR9_9MICC|nr:Nicotine blue oxidoreductase [Arthrobacter saudimassiliensis]
MDIRGGAGPGAGRARGHARPAVSAVLLAAGAGTRLGAGPKALLPYRGRTLAAVLAETLRDAGCSTVVLVLGAEARRVAAAAGLAEYVLEVNPDWQQGMGSSFRRGVARALAADPDAGVLVALADQPGLTPGLVRRLADAHAARLAAAPGAQAGPAVPGAPGARPGPAVPGTQAGPVPATRGAQPAADPPGAASAEPSLATAAAYRSADGRLRRGHPVLFSPAAARAAAAGAAGDAGARAWLRANPAAVRLVDCSDLSDGRDIDTPADLPLLDTAPPGAG